MSGVKHTPGPLLAIGNEVRKPLSSDSGLTIAVARCAGSNEEAEANAALYAAAPDLLEALTEARLTLSLTRTNIMVEMKKSEGAAYRWEGVPELLANRIVQCDAAITRATGDRPEKGGAL